MGLAIEMVNPLLESFGEPTKAYVTNSSRPLANFKGKGNPDLPSVYSTSATYYSLSAKVSTKDAL